MTSFALKMIAIITMLIDHIGAVLIPYDNRWYMLFRGIGRLSFPIFCFLIVEGFNHTKNVKNYLIRLGVFAFVSEIPFDLAFYHKMFSWQHQNVFFTLFLGLLLITLMNKVDQKFKDNIMMSSILKIILTIGICLIAFFMKTDYDFSGILIIAAFYIFRSNKVYMAFSLLFIMLYILGEKGQNFIYFYAVFSMIFISFYNGKKGKDIKLIFYIFYPAHLFILYLIDKFL